MERLETLIYDPLLAYIAESMAWALDSRLIEREYPGEEITGRMVWRCYWESCWEFYNGAEEDYADWAVEAGFDLERPSASGPDGYSERDAWYELAGEYTSEILRTLDWDSIPKEWLFHHLEKNKERRR